MGNQKQNTKRYSVKPGVENFRKQPGNSENDFKAKSKSNKFTLYIVSFLLILIIACLYGKTAAYDFTLDDGIVISKNINVQKGITAIPAIFGHTTYYGSDLGYTDKTYRPLSLSSYAAEISLFGLNPGIHHLVNLIFYAMICILLYHILSLYVFKNFNKYIIALIIILFAIHPVHTEVVCNIKSRDEILCFLTFILSLLCLFRAFKIDNQKNKFLNLSLSSVLFFISLFTKETAVTFIFLFPLFMYFFVNFDLKKDKKILIYYFASLIFFLLLYLLIRGLVLSGIKAMEVNSYNNALLEFGIFDRICMTMYIMLLYIKLLFIPYPLSWDYSYGHFQMDSSIIILGIFSVIIYSGLLIYALLKLRQKEILSFCILFYLTTMALVSNVFIAIASTMGERFLFIPSLAFCIFLVIFAGRILKINFNQFKFKRNPIFITIFSVIIIFFVIDSYSRASDWKDNLTLMTQEIKHSKSLRTKLVYITQKNDSIKVMKQNKAEYESLINDIDKFIIEFPEKPEKAKLWFWKAQLNANINNNKQAIEDFQKVLLYDKQDILAYNNIGSLKIKEGMPESAITYFNNSLLINNQNPDTYLSRGNAYMSINKLNEALADLNKAISLNSKLSDAYIDRGELYNKEGKPLLAIDDFNKVISISPDNYLAYNTRGVSLFNLKQYDKAKIDFSQSIKLNPNYSNAWDNRGNANFFLKNQTEACKDWQKSYMLGNLISKSKIDQYCK